RKLSNFTTHLRSQPIIIAFFLPSPLTITARSPPTSTHRSPSLTTTHHQHSSSSSPSLIIRSSPSPSQTETLASIATSRTCFGRLEMIQKSNFRREYSSNQRESKRVKI
ncbi:hypothetical protein PIB30_103243, partial [Stylosanthes scabra]|nr:hypothetical protein [Stylosanthes scabra]